MSYVSTLTGTKE